MRVSAEPSTRRERVTLAAVVVLGLALTGVAVTVLIGQALNDHQIDLAVFQDAGAAYVNGFPLYSEDFPTRSGLRFIYAPIAAVLFAPMTLLEMTTLQLLWSAVNVALVWWVLAAVLRKLDVSRPAVAAFAALGAALILEPVRSNFGFGQINIILMALVVADCAAVLPRRVRGIATAIAASIKITPAAFGLFFLVRSDYASIARAVATAITVAAVGIWLLPGASVHFWLTEFFATERGGGHGFVRNQAFTGVLARLGVDGLVKDAVWALAAVAIVGAAAWSARRFTRSHEPMLALAVVALASLLAAPFAVTHHWVYSVLLIPLTIAPQYRSWRLLLVGSIAVFVIAPYQLLDGIDSTTGSFELALRHIGGNAQFLTALVLLAAAVVAARNRHPDPVPTAPKAVVAA